MTTAGSTTYSFDANGNQTGASGGLSFAYNAKDQTSSITPAGGSAISMTYRGPNQTERVTAGGNSYQYDSTGLSAATTSAGTAYLTKTPGGELISERLPSGTYYYLYDGLGSVVGLTDSSGKLVNSYAYDPYGNTTSVSETVSNPFRFIGAIWDASTGLYKMGDRYYDPTVGRFTQLDPLGEGYVYASDNPINFVDPGGLMPKRASGGGGVYVLTDENGSVVRTGRTNNLARRGAEHERYYEGRYRFKPVYRTNDYREQRGLEQKVYERNTQTLHSTIEGPSLRRTPDIRYTWMQPRVSW